MRVNFCPSPAYAKLYMLTLVFYRLSSVTSCISMVLSDIFQDHCLFCFPRGLTLTFPLRLSQGRTVCCGTACWLAVAQYLGYRSQGIFCQAGSSCFSKILHNKKLLWTAWALHFLNNCWRKKVDSVMPIGCSLQYILKNSSCLAFIFCCLFSVCCFVQTPTAEDYGHCSSKA